MITYHLLQTLRACITCGKKAGQCKCLQTKLPPAATATAAKDDLWHLEVDSWQTKHAKPSSPSDYFNVQEKADLRRWFESLSSFSQGCIPSNALIFQLISSNIINDEKGLRTLLQHEKSPATYTFYSFMALMEKRQTKAEYRRQLKCLVALSRPKSKGGQGLLLSVSAVVAERRRKKLLDGMIQDTMRRQGEADSVFDLQAPDIDSHAYVSVSERQQKRDELRLQRQQRKSQKHMDSYIDTVQQVIDDDRNALKKSKQLSSLPVSLRQQQNKKRISEGGYNGCFDHIDHEDSSWDRTKHKDKGKDKVRGDAASPLPPLLWGEHGLEKEREMDRDFRQSLAHDTVNANAKTIARLIPPRDQQKQQKQQQQQQQSSLSHLCSPKRSKPRLQKQKSFDQLVLTKEKSFHRLHIQWSDSFAPKASCSFLDGSDDDSNDDYNDDDDSDANMSDYAGACDGAGDIFDQLDRQILEKTLQNLCPLKSSAASSLLQVTPVKRPPRMAKVHPAPLPRVQAVTSTPSSSGGTPLLLTHVPDLSPPPPNRGPLRRVHDIERGNSKPFSPVDKQQLEQSKMKTLLTPQDKRNALKASKKQESHQRQHKANRSSKQPLGLNSQYSGDSSSSSHAIALHPPSKEDHLGGTLYDFVQHME